MEYTAIIRKSPDGWYAAQCAQVPEAITQGKTIEEAKDNLLDAINLVLQFKKDKTLKMAKTDTLSKFICRKIIVL